MDEEWISNIVEAEDDVKPLISVEDRADFELEADPLLAETFEDWMRFSCCIAAGFSSENKV